MEKGDETIERQSRYAEGRWLWKLKGGIPNERINWMRRQRKELGQSLAKKIERCCCQ